MVKIHCVITRFAFGEARTPAEELERQRFDRLRFFDLRRALLSGFNVDEPAYQRLANCLWPEQLAEVLMDLEHQFAADATDAKRVVRALSDKRSKFFKRYDDGMKWVFQEARDGNCQLSGRIQNDPRSVTRDITPEYLRGDCTIDRNWTDLGPCLEGQLPGQILFSGPCHAPIFYDVRIPGEQANELLKIFSACQQPDRRRNSDREIKDWYVNGYIRKHVKAGARYDREHAEEIAKKLFPHAIKLRSLLRNLRKEHAPSDWQKPGPRRN